MRKQTKQDKKRKDKQAKQKQVRQDLAKFVGKSKRLKQKLTIQTPEGSKIVNVARNDPCPCGSGLKYKKCHSLPFPERLENLRNAFKVDKDTPLPSNIETPDDEIHTT